MQAAGGIMASEFEQFSGDVYAWAFRLLGRHHDALDVVQDVYLRWDDQCRREPPTNIRGWLRRVTLNRAIDIRRGDAGSRSFNEVSEPAQDAGRIESREALDEAVLRDDVAVALKALTEMQRSVLVAKVYDDMTFAEIADEMQLSASTVKTHYLRALRAVRDRLSPRWWKEMTV